MSLCRGTEGCRGVRNAAIRTIAQKLQAATGRAAARRSDSSVVLTSSRASPSQHPQHVVQPVRVRTSSNVRAPRATAWRMSWSETAWQTQTYIADLRGLVLEGRHLNANANDCQVALGKPTSISTAHAAS